MGVKICFCLKLIFELRDILNMLKSIESNGVNRRFFFGIEDRYKLRGFRGFKIYIDRSIFRIFFVSCCFYFVRELSVMFESLRV